MATVIPFVGKKVARSTTEIYREVYADLMKYNRDALVEIAFTEYNVMIPEGTREDIAGMCANIEVDNYVR